MACCIFVCLTVTKEISAAGPTSNEKVSAVSLTFGKYGWHTTRGTTSQETNSEFFKFETKRRYNMQVTLVVEYENAGKLDISVFDDNGICVKSANNTRDGWTFNKEKNHSVNTFMIDKLKKGTYYIEVTEKNINKDVKFSVKVVPVMLDKVKGAAAAQVEAGSKNVKVTWTPIKGAAITGYVVYRSTKKNGKYTKVAKVEGSKKKSATVKQKLGKKYYYKVRAYDTTSSNYVTIYSKYSKAVAVKTVK